MKKLLPFSLILLTLVFISSAAIGQVTFAEVWAYYGENAPSWFTDGTEPNAPGGDPSFAASERGIVYSPSTGHVYVSSRHPYDKSGEVVGPEPHVYILDAASGEAATPLDQLLTIGITSDQPNYGGGYPLNNVTIGKDGSIFACNMTLSSGPFDEVNKIIKAFRVYRWSWEQDVPIMIIDYPEGGYRLGDKMTVLGDWDSEAYIYAVANETTKVLRWKVTSGIVEATPDIITLQDISTVGTSPTVAGVPGKDDWIYVSGKGVLPTLFTTEGLNLTQVAITSASLPGVIAGRITEFAGKLYMGMFSGDQNAFIFDITKHGENVTDADVIGFTPAFGTRYTNAYGEGAVEFGVINDSLYVFICAPTNGIACYRIDGLVSTPV